MERDLVKDAGFFSRTFWVQFPKIWAVAFNAAGYVAHGRDRNSQLTAADAPRHSMEHTRAVLRECLGGREIEDVFESWEPTPVASGSIAQVYRARLRAEEALPDGRVDVAVKVRHPGVLDETFADIDLIFAFITTIGEGCGHLTIPFSKDDFHRVLQQQVDLRWEAYNLGQFQRNFAAEGEVGGFPAVHPRLLAPGLLVEEWLPGTPVSDIFADVG
eukprot:CAMPEP_0113683092 /NCGR_PEP_ID=MMETSP0038_2-20120614/13078_1 /TAXON_ID=2898 /ORGANISM="Cryptomonas paramecium" /LENGTH=215 /DNA_ID=CAMNT_0000602337 /DNA_START=385 /DNA_END=1029 /DNA_ORIENTATION=+ /assembly_acc=CAM_ASM_000170